MNKKLNKIIILLITSLLLFGILSVTSIAYNNTDRNIIIGIKWTSGPELYEIKEYDLRNVNQVSIIQHPEKEGSNYVSILNQPNVWCVQHGKDLSGGEFSVSEEREIRNNILAYILCHGPEMGTLPDNTISPAQIALWQYLNENANDEEVKEITANNICDAPKAGDRNVTQELLDAGLKLLNEAKEYANTLGNKAPTLKLALNGNYLQITVGGSFKNYKVFINGKQYTVGSVNGIYSKEINLEKEINVPVTEIAAGEAKVKIEALGQRYKASYRALSNANQQRLIVVTNAVTEDSVDGTIEKTQVLYTNVSLQKYITKVNDKTLTNNETNLENRKNTYSTVYETDGRAKKHPSKTDTATTNYKKENVVNIEAGDTVTYRIHVYNNSDITAKTVEVRDKLLYYGNTQYGNYEILSITRDGNTRNIKNEWKYVSNTTPHEYQYTIDNLPGNSSTYFDITVKLSTYVENQIIDNTAYINYTWPTNKDDYRTLDRDYIKMKPYKVSLQKIVDSVNGQTSGITSFDRWNSWESNENIKNNENMTYEKHNNPVIVQNGNYVTYAIRVKNDGETKVYIDNIKDTLPEGLSEYKIGRYNSSNPYEKVPEDRILNIKLNRIFNPGDTEIVYVTAKVSEPNISISVLQNKAEITDISNKNRVPVKDTTPDNNQDADYIQLQDIVISGTVWNDKALDKKQDNYNGQYDEKNENKLEGIKVYLYRNGKGIIAQTVTDSNGNYKFDASMIDASVVTHECERHIKAPYECRNKYTNNIEHKANYWKENSYYAYYILFEYDGITYTNTVMGDINAENYTINSNAKEDNGAVKETRQSFNNRFSTINNQSGISYTTKNEKGYLPQSNHIYNENTMSMQASTNIIQLSNNVDLEEQLQHVNLGLRGRDIFDLELASDVYSTKVTVNGQEGEYNYNRNKVTVRKSDINVAEDAANFASETREGTVGEIEQAVRNTDLDVSKTNSNYSSTGLGIEVTYKISVTNALQTVGTASKVINYYDSRYEFVKAYVGNQELNVETGTSGNGYNSVIITTPGTKLTQSQTMEIYVTYRLKYPTQTLAGLLSGAQTIPTYNMAEVYEYKTFATNNEATRGLLDKDSAPGSVGTEKVRLVNGTSNETTVEYYFKAQNLSNLKYEDDTYATPMLYFTKNDSVRTLSGIVFKDSTTTNEETRIKTGNGIKDENEVGVYGATVELVELNNKITPENVTLTDGTVRYTTTTNTEGVYTFTNFLPGNYVVRYYYGDTAKTVLLKQNGDVNNYSFNGEDYQSTNNIGAYGANRLDKTDSIWYAYNEKDKISTATDNDARREDVTKNVTNFTDEEMTVLNNARDGKAVTEEEVKKLIENTNMYATTPNFTLTVEKTETNKDNKDPKQKTEFSDYNVANMNFGISEVPVTTIDLQKHVDSFIVKDSTGENTIASAQKQENGEWNIKGDVLPLEGSIFDISIEDEKLQGAKLQVTYNISISMTTEKDFRNKELTVPTIDGIVDYVDNDLSYNETLGDNNKYWKVESYENLKGIFALSQYKEGTVPTGTVDATGEKYTTTLVATENNPILLKQTGSASCPITLEKTLSATETTVQDIITSNVNTYEYNNNVEILKLNYKNTNPSGDGSIPYRDRVRTPERYIILAGTQHDSATSETITIHPPTGDNSIGMNYYIVIAISLAILSAGIVLIKKYAIKKD